MCGNGSLALETVFQNPPYIWEHQTGTLEQTRAGLIDTRLFYTHNP